MFMQRTVNMTDLFMAVLVLPSDTLTHVKIYLNDLSPFSHRLNRPTTVMLTFGRSGIECLPLLRLVISGRLIRNHWKARIDIIIRNSLQLIKLLLIQ